jgi:hypothetical protein
VASGFLDQPRNFILPMAITFDQLPVRVSFFNGVQILPLNILDQC